jgi:hypothetical protein
MAGETIRRRPKAALPAPEEAGTAAARPALAAPAAADPAAGSEGGALASAFASQPAPARGAAGAENPNEPERRIDPQLLPQTPRLAATD